MLSHYNNCTQYNTEMCDSKESVKVNCERKTDILSTHWLTHNTDIETVAQYNEITVFESKVFAYVASKTD